MNPKSMLRICLSVLALAVLCACSPAVEVGKKRYFWPPGEQQPRIEYINFFQVEQDIRRDQRSLMEEYVLGKEQPEYIFRQPQGIVSDGKGKVYISDISRDRVFLYDFSTLKVSLLNAQDGGTFSGKVWGLALDPAGRLYASMSTRAEIVIFSPDGKLLENFGKEHLANPAGIAYDSLRQRLLVADTKKHQLVLFSPQGEFLATLGKRGSGPGEFNFPTDVSVDADGNLYVLDSLNARVQVFDPDLQFVRMFGERGTALGSFMVAKSLAVSPAGHVYVTDSLAHRVVIFDREGNFLLTFGGKYFVTDKVAPGGFYMPAGIDVDANNTIWIADSLNRMFHQFQYLDERYLAEHPIRPGEAVQPQSTEIDSLPEFRL